MVARRPARVLLSGQAWHLLDAAARTDAQPDRVARRGVARRRRRHAGSPPAATAAAAGRATASRSSSTTATTCGSSSPTAAGAQPHRRRGRKTRTELRVQRLEADETKRRRARHRPGKPLFLRARQRGDARHRASIRDALRPARHRRSGCSGATRAIASPAAREDADVVLVSASRFDEFPDLHATDSTFKTLAKVTNGGAQMQPFAWGTSELVRFERRRRAAQGGAVQAGELRPEEEVPDDRLHLRAAVAEPAQLREPGARHIINLAYYASNGYLVLMPDIVYTDRPAGPERAQVRAAGDPGGGRQGLVDEKRASASRATPGAATRSPTWSRRPTASAPSRRARRWPT